MASTTEKKVPGSEHFKADELRGLELKMHGTVRRIVSVHTTSRYPYGTHSVTYTLDIEHGKGKREEFNFNGVLSDRIIDHEVFIYQKAPNNPDTSRWQMLYDAHDRTKYIVGDIGE